MKIKYYISLLLLPLFFLSAQDQEGGESAAEASVTGSASSPVMTPPESSDSNPIVSMVRIGVPINDALKFNVSQVFKLAIALNKGGKFDLANFAKAAKLLGSGTDIDDLSNALDNELSIDDISDAVEQGLDLSKVSSGSSDFTGYTNNSLLKTAILDILPTGNYDVDIFQSALTEAIKLADNFLVDRTIQSESDLATSISVASLATPGYNYELVRLLASYGAIGSRGSAVAGDVLGTDFTSLTNTGSLSALSSTSSYLGFLKAFSGSATFGDGDTSKNIKSDIDSTVLDIPLSNIQLTTGSVINFGSPDSQDYSSGFAPETLDGLTAYSTEIDSLGNQETSLESISNGIIKTIHSDPFSESIITAQTPEGTLVLEIDEGFLTETTPEGTGSSTALTLVQLNANEWKATYDGESATFNFNTKKGTFEGEGENFEFTFSQVSTTGTPYTYKTLENGNKAELVYTFSNENDPKPEKYTIDFTNPNGGTYTWVEYTDSTMEEVTGEGGSGTFNLSEESQRPLEAGDVNVDVTSILGKEFAAPNNDSDGTNNRSDRNVYVIGAAKDINFNRNVVFKNDNDAEDHALVVAAADDFMLDGHNITYEGSNLGLGAGSEDAAEFDMYLHNTKISTGGNLAAGTLGKLSISDAEFVVGTANPETSDPDNVYLYANELIQVNDLDFTGSRLDDVYMEAITINLNNITFPAGSDLMFRSKNGEVDFDTYSNPTVGAVNFTNVSYEGQGKITQDSLNEVSSGYNSKFSLPNGTPAIKVRKQYHD